MKIKFVKTIILKSELETPFEFSQGWVGNRVCTLVKVKTDEGLTGCKFVIFYKESLC